MLEVLERGIISEETAKESAKYYRDMLVMQGKGPEFYIRTLKKSGFLSAPVWDIQLWRRG